MSIARSGILYFLEFLSSIPKRIKNWILVRIFGKHKRYEVFNPLFGAHGNRVAVFAVYPGTTTLGSVLRIVESLQSQHYSILIVMNKNPSRTRFLSALQKKNCSILLRNNIGADFGAYQAGINYLKKSNLYVSIESLVLVNDSMFVTQNSQKTITTIVSPTSNFNCLFLHHEGISHAGSMLLQIDQKALQSKEFLQFWHRYYPHVVKRKIVRKGEHKLSAVLGIKNFFPYINHESIRFETSYFLNQSEILQVLTAARRSSDLTFFYISNAIQNSAWRETFSYVLSNLQVSIALGLNLARVMHTPLKMDLKKLGVTSGGAYMELARESGCSRDEIRELQEILYSKGGFLTDGLVNRIYKSHVLRGKV